MREGTGEEGGIGKEGEARSREEPCERGSSVVNNQIITMQDLSIYLPIFINPS